MTELIIMAWEKNKDRLEEYLKTHRQEEYDDYGKLLKLIFTEVINPYLRSNDEISYPYSTGFNAYNIRRIDDGDYQGTLIYLCPLNVYQPSEEEYITTFVSYGSCSGCDTLLGISHYTTGLPTTEQVKDYMSLCLHIVQRMKEFRGGV